MWVILFPIQCCEDGTVNEMWFLEGITEHSLPSSWHFEMWNATDKITFIS